MNKRIVLLAWIIALPTILNAGNPVEEKFRRNIISFNLATPFDPNFPRLRFGYTFIVSNYYSQTFEMGYGSHRVFPESSFYLHEDLNPNYRLWEMRTESRYLVSGVRKYVIPYTGFELYYIRHRQTMLDDNFKPEDEELSIYYYQADFLRTKTGFNVKGGFIFKMGPAMAFEIYGGIGVRLRHNHYYNVDIKEVREISGLFDNWNYYYNEGPKWSYNLTGGFKMDFLF